MFTTLDIAIYGAVVASISVLVAGITAYTQYNTSKAGLLIVLDKKSFSYFFKTKDFGLDTYNCNIS